MARGDIEVNLNVLSSADQPSEHTASQCWLLMQVGFNLRQFVATVQLLQDSAIAKQRYDSLAALKRAHFEYHEGTLVVRAQVAIRRPWPKSMEDTQLFARAMKNEALLAQKKARSNQRSPGVFRCAGAPRGC